MIARPRCCLPRTALLGLALALTSPLPLTARADPPPWAPAHGGRDAQEDRSDDRRDERRDDRRDERRDEDRRDERREHAHRDDHGERAYRGYGDRGWDDDYGVSGGRCNRAAVGAVLGGVAGGVVGSQVGQGRDRPVATVIGAVVGALIGHKIGGDMDASDRACMGHAFELGRDGRPVEWRNDERGVRYVVTPVRAWPQGGPACREVRIQSYYGERSRAVTRYACRAGDGEWRLRSR